MWNNTHELNARQHGYTICEFVGQRAKHTDDILKYNFEMLENFKLLF